MSKTIETMFIHTDCPCCHPTTFFRLALQSMAMKSRKGKERVLGVYWMNHKTKSKIGSRNLHLARITIDYIC